MTEIVTRTAQPLIFVILARLLTPEDFGVMGTALIVISFVQMFWDAGLSKALIQTDIAPEKAASVVFWTNVTIGLALYLIICISSSWIAAFFDSPSSQPVLCVLGLQVVILSLTSVQQALFVRDLNFRQLFWAKLAMAITPACFSIPLAFFGFGVWALVIGTLVGSSLNMLILWSKSPWRPALNYDMQVARTLFAFGVWVMGESFGAWLMLWGDQLLIAKLLNVNDLGVYRVGWSFLIVVFSLFLNFFLPVLYPTFSRLQGDRDRLIAVFHRANRVIISLALPIGTGLFVTGPYIADVLFGEQWQGLGHVISIVGLAQGLSWTIGVNAEVYRAIGRPGANTKLMYFQLAYQLPAYLVALQYGLKAFVLTRLGVTIFAVACHVFVCVRVLEVPWFYLWRQGKSMIQATLVMLMALLALQSLLVGIAAQAVTLLSLTILGAFVYVVAIWLLDRQFLHDVRRLAARAVQI